MSKRDIIGYHVYATAKGGLWLCDDERSWSRNFTDAAEFTDAGLAADIGDRENPNDCMGTIYVFACMGS